MTYLQWRFFDKSNCRFFLCYDEFGSEVPVWCAGHPQGCVALFVIVFGTSDPDVRSLWSLFGILVWLFVTGMLVCGVDIGSTLVRAITAFDRGGRSRRVLLRDSYLGVD